MYISLRLNAFGTYLCGKALRQSRDLGDMSQNHIDATIYQYILYI